MARAMVGGAFLGAHFDVVLDRIHSPLVVDFIRGKNLDPLLQRLEENLTVVKAVLNDAEKKQINDPQVNKWLDDLKHVVYMADDLLDELATKAAVTAAAATQKEVTTTDFNTQDGDMATKAAAAAAAAIQNEVTETRNKVRKLLSRFFNAQDGDMATRFTQIVDKLDRILKLKESLGLKEIATENMSSRVPSTSVPDRNIYGRDEDKEAIIKLLLDDNNSNEGEGVSVIPIVGIGGVGKTTLAQMVYNDDNLKQILNFDFKAWVCVSEEFDIIKVSKNLTEALIPEEASKLMNLNSLQEKLVEKLKGKKFLVILDDVWIEDYHNWNLLKKPFQYGIRGSKILVTTRSDKVASAVQTVQTYHLSQLSNEDCWLVFANHACLSPGSGENTAALKKIGMDIVKKCGGLPLAAQSFGGLLRRKHDVKYWNNVLKSDIWELSESESNIIPSLRVSYHYLPPYLKRCFVHCSLYPKDYNLKKNDVIQLWMAEDLLPPPKRGKTLQDVGDECFDYLVSSSFLQRSSDPWNKACFVMHDLMHDLAIFIGGEFYFRSYNLGEETTIGRKTRHLSFINYSCPSSDNFGGFSGSKFLRTFLRIMKYESRDGDSPCTDFCNLECLRVLSCRFFKNLIALPDSIGGLIHLRYLNLSCTGIESLPESLCSLYNLQTLKLENCRNLTMLPSGTQNLVNLHYLGIDQTGIEEMPKGMSKLKQLQHLPYFIVGKHEEIKIKELGGLSNLQGSFSIRKLENVNNGNEALEARMMDKKHIQCLELSWSSDEDCMDFQTEMDILCKLEPHQDLLSLDIIGYRGTRYPDWVGKPCFPNMTRLELFGCHNCFTLPSLGHLPSLRDLTISDWKTLVSADGSFFNNNKNNNDGIGSLLMVPFPSLESLVFENMPCWEVWSCFEQPGAFPLLMCLKIRGCPKLREDLPSHLPALKQLEILDCEQLTWSLPRAPAMHRVTIARANKVMESVFGAIINKQSSCLQSLQLKDCPSAMSFPGDCLPVSLETLEIHRCRELEFPHQQQTHELLKSLFMISSCDSLTSLPLESFPNLTDLHIACCENLESISVSEPSLQNLSGLSIYSCPNLVSLVREGLVAPSLKRFNVCRCDKLESLPPRMNTLLPNLESLLIACPRIESFPEGGMPPSLTSIEIRNCGEKLLSVLSSMDMLTSITIGGPCDWIKSFRKQGLLLPPSLKKLSLDMLSSLETLDCKGLLHLTHLRELVIEYCPKLKNLAGERLPPSLTKLHIYDCPLLGEQCRMKHPQIWPKISHIHYIKVDYKQIS